MKKTEYRTLIADVARRLGYDPDHVDRITMAPDRFEVHGAWFQDGYPIVIDRKGYALFHDTIELED